MLVHISWSIENVRVSAREIFYWLKCLPLSTEDWNPVSGIDVMTRHGVMCFLYQHWWNRTRDPRSLLVIQPSLINELCFPVLYLKTSLSTPKKQHPRFTSDFHICVCICTYILFHIGTWLCIHIHTSTYIQEIENVKSKVVSRLFGWASLRLTRSICIWNK